MSHTNTNANTLELTDATFDHEVLAADRPVLVDFWAEWCAPCRALGPTIDTLADEYAGRVTVAKLDVDAHAEVAGRLEIRSIPTVILFKGGQPVQRFTGLTSKHALGLALDALVA